MMYATIISLLIETTLKPFYLLRPQSFNSFQIVYRYIHYRYIFGFMSQGWGLLTPCFVPRGGFLYITIVPRGRVFVPFKSCPGSLSQGGGGMVLDEIDTCIKRHRDTGYSLSFPSQFIHR